MPNRWQLISLVVFLREGRGIMKRELKNALWSDMETDEERVEFLRSGRAWKTGVISQSLINDVADAFEYRVRVRAKREKGGKR